MRVGMAQFKTRYQKGQESHPYNEPITRDGDHVLSNCIGLVGTIIMKCRRCGRSISLDSKKELDASCGLDDLFFGLPPPENVFQTHLEPCFVCL